MSSPRSAFPADATIHRADKAVGAVLLPENEPSLFVAQFNRIYGPIGLTMRTTAKSSETVQSSRAFTSSHASD